MTEPKHPSMETQEEREAAYRELRKNIVRQLRLHGVSSLMIVLTDQPVSSVERGFVNHRRDQRFSLTRSHVQYEDPSLTLRRTRVDETNTMEEVQYHCAGRGPFARNDFSADVLQSNASPEEQALHQAKMTEHVAANIDALESGLTGLPITAEEALDLIDLVSDAEPLPDPFDRAVAAW